MSGSYANPFTWEQAKKGPFVIAGDFVLFPALHPPAPPKHRKKQLLTPEQRGQPDPEERDGQRRRRIPSAWTATIGESRTWRRRGRWSDLLPSDVIGASAFHNQPARGRWAAEAEADPDGDGDEAGAPPPTSSSLKRCGGRARSSAERGTVGRTPPPLRADGDDRGGPDAATTGAQRCGGQARSSAERWGGRRLSYARAATIGETRTWRRRGRWSDPLPGEGGGGP